MPIQTHKTIKSLKHIHATLFQTKRHLRLFYNFNTTAFWSLTDMTMNYCKQKSCIKIHDVSWHYKENIPEV